MKVLFLTIGSKKTPSTRFRVKQYLSGLSADRFEVTHLPIPHSIIKRFSILKHLYGNDVVVIQKKLFSALELWLIKMINPNIIYDFDDNVLVEHPIHKQDADLRKKLKKKEKRFVSTLKASRLIIAGNSYLKGLAETYNPDVVVIPTPVDTDRYIPGTKDSEKEVINIGWIGSRSNLFYLDGIASALRVICSKYPRARLRIVCDKSFSAEGIQMEFVPWSEDNEISELQGFDIGIMPLAGDAWSQGKCGFKLLQYMAVGIPVVASPVGANTDIVSNGINGFLAGTTDEWVTSISRLVEDKELRIRFGSEGRKTVEQGYSVTSCITSLEDAFRKVNKSDR